MNIHGKLIREDLGSGVWRLVDADGKHWLLDGKIAANLAGERVVVEGTEQEVSGIGMTGDPTLKVTAVRRG